MDSSDTILQDVSYKTFINAYKQKLYNVKVWCGDSHSVSTSERQSLRCRHQDGKGNIKVVLRMLPGILAYGNDLRGTLNACTVARGSVHTTRTCHTH